jgi:hypothetical protein
VESSYAFAALDNAGRVITEGVYWPEVSANVVSNARAFAARLAAPRERAALWLKWEKPCPVPGIRPGVSGLFTHQAGIMCISSDLT